MNEEAKDRIGDRSAPTAVIQICGDPTVDWLSCPQLQEAEGPYFWPPFEPMPSILLSSQAGGAALTTAFVRKLLANRAEIKGVHLDQELLMDPHCNRITRTWTVWSPWADSDKKPPIFRLREWQGCESGCWPYSDYRLDGKADLLVIEDTGLGFRDAPQGWPECVTYGDKARRPAQILLKLTHFSPEEKDDAYNYGHNSLLHAIVQQELAPLTTVLVAIKDLRACPVWIGTSLSWEQLLEDIVRAVRSDACPLSPSGRKGSPFQRVVVTIGTSGAVIVEENRSILVFDRNGQEDDFQRLHPGQMMGYNTCVMGALTVGWALGRDQPDWPQRAVYHGVSLGRLLHLKGYELADGTRRCLQFPHVLLAEAYHDLDAGGKRRDELQIASNLGIFVDGKDSGSGLCGGRWSILQQVVLDPSQGGRLTNAQRAEAVCCYARDIVRKGPEAVLSDVPVETIRNWRSADRLEIEGMRSAYNAMEAYLRADEKKTPLSVAIFGPPGAGKSFAVKQIAEKLGIIREDQLTFNLSQYESPDDLARAFHQIRDLHVKGKTPLVFWDEFDAAKGGNPLGWLRYFLAPMQDGEFMEHGTVHPVGGGIYIFAGATRRSFQEFSDGNGQEEREAKKPDFISRLSAFIDVRGPNGSPNSIEDPLFIIRRAFLFHHALDAHAKHLRGRGGYEIEPGILDAFLRVTHYKHGARSIDSIVRMSNLSGRRKYELSALPPDHLLRMHVNLEEFKSLAAKGQRELLRIGITGHIGLDPVKMPRIEQGIERAIDRIQRAYPNHYLTVFSPMARGSDRMVSRRLLARGALLIVVLPSPAGDYINDFGPSDLHFQDYQGAELRQEFRFWLRDKAIEVIEMPPSSTRRESYQKAGYFIAEHCDIMVAVWDGRDPQGIGGTAAVVRKAQELGKPIFHVWAGNFKDDPRKRTEPLEETGKVRFINLPGNKPGQWAE